MNLLLDTHAFIWWYSEPEKLPDRVLAACQDVTNLLALSVASVWEMQIKAQLGKLQLAKPLSEIIQHQQEQNQLQLLPVTLPIVLALDDLPMHHRDPFDRLLIAQARMDQFVLVSNDSQFKQYPVSLFWN
ncbi:MAG: type II toxin-antitoxin system VapC family toxin [Chloroflexi bacterium]|nr:type II toxin-antitoxin system VapC family toxin [Chloroflexota bacterium]